MVADIEELGNLDASEIHCSKTAKEVSTSTKGEKVLFADGTTKLCGRDREVRESTPRQYYHAGSEDLRGKFEANSDGSQSTEANDDAEARNDFWSIEGDFIYRHHFEPRVQLCVPKEESLPIPLRY